MRLFHSNRTLVLVFLPVIIGIYVSFNLYFDYHAFEPHTSFGLWGSLEMEYALPSFMLAPALIFLNAILLNVIFNRNEFMERNSYIVSLLYIVLMSYFHTFYYVDGLGIAQLFLVLALQQVFRLNQNEDSRKRAFNIAFLTGIGASFYPVLLLALPFLFWIIWVFRPFVLREAVLIIVGFVLPLIYARVYRWYFMSEFSTEEISSSSHEVLMADLITVAAFTSVFVVLCLKRFFQKIQLGSIRIRKLYSILYKLSFLILGMAVIEFFFFHKVQVLSMLFVVLMFALPFAFGIKQPRAATVFFFYLCFFYSLGKFFIDLVI